MTFKAHLLYKKNRTAKAHILMAHLTGPAMCHAQNKFQYAPIGCIKNKNIKLETYDRATEGDLD